MDRISHKHKIYLDTHLDSQQIDIITAPRGPVCVFAGAGTGKTNTIINRIGYIVATGRIPANQILAVTFTVRAANEMKSRLYILGQKLEINTKTVQVATFHSAAYKQLKYFWKKLIGNVRWKLLENKLSIIKQASSKSKLEFSNTELHNLAIEIEWAKGSLIAPEDYARIVDKIKHKTSINKNQVAEVYLNYEALKTHQFKSLLLDFDDLLLYIAAAIENDFTIAQEFYNFYRCFVVDEYQDITPLQQRVLDAWLGKRDDITVVGDPNQSIYSFIGSNSCFLLNFSKKFSSSFMAKFERNYRSTPQILTLANKLIHHAKSEIKKHKIFLVGQKKIGPKPTFFEYPDDITEAYSIVQSIRSYITYGINPSEIAVLYRTNLQSKIYKEALNSSRILYQINDNETFFDYKDISQILILMQNLAKKNISEGKLISFINNIFKLSGLTTNPPSNIKAYKRWKSLKALKTLINQEISKNQEIKLLDLITKIHQIYVLKNTPYLNDNSITLASLHSSKGLEWNVVFIIGINDGMLPTYHSLFQGTCNKLLEEERRLLYVGITRARIYLSISWALKNTPTDSSHVRSKSRFLKEISPQL